MSSILDPLYQGWAALVSGLSNWLGPAKTYPYNLITILLVCLTLAIISAAATRAVVDVEAVRRRNNEFREWQSAMSKAMKEKDQKTIDKLKKRQQAIQNAQMAGFKDQLKPLIITLVPFWIFYGIFSGVFGYNSLPVGLSPINFPLLADGGTTFVFYTFYFICTFGTSPLIQRLFNLPSVTD